MIALFFLVDITNQRDLKALLEIRINLNVKLSMCSNFNFNLSVIFNDTAPFMRKGIIFKFSVEGALLAQWLLRDLVLQSLNRLSQGPVRRSITQASPGTPGQVAKVHPPAFLVSWTFVASIVNLTKPAEFCVQSTDSIRQSKS